MTIVTFSYTDGLPRPWIVPAGVTSVTADVSGAAGGNSADQTVSGGLGGEIKGTFTVSPGETLLITPAGQGGISAGGIGDGNGGDGGSAAVNGSGGGGASSVSRGSTRLLLAGGGGGATSVQFGIGGIAGGNGGGTTAQAGANGIASTGGQGGSNGVGGTGGTGNPPFFTSGANGGNSASTGANGGNGGGNRPGQLGGSGGGGGGGGWGGGGGGGGGFPGSGGGGGASFAAPQVTNVTSLQGVRSGNGSVTLTFVAAVRPTLSTQACPRTVETCQPFHDTATLTNGNNPTGSLYFALFRRGHSCVRIATKRMIVNGNGTYKSPSFKVKRPGRYYFQVQYSGDSNNLPTSTNSLDLPLETVCVKPGLSQWSCFLKSKLLKNVPNCLSL